jgi:hypothetical protein
MREGERYDNLQSEREREGGGGVAERERDRCIEKERFTIIRHAHFVYR